MAIHLFDGARAITGADPVSVYCESWNPPHSWFGGPAAASAVFQMSGGVRFSFDGDWSAQGFQTSWTGSWRAIGEHGSAVWDGAGRSARRGRGRHRDHGGDARRGAARPVALPRASRPRSPTSWPRSAPAACRRASATTTSRASRCATRRSSPPPPASRCRSTPSAWLTASGRRAWRAAEPRPEPSIVEFVGPEPTNSTIDAVTARRPPRRSAARGAGRRAPRPPARAGTSVTAVRTGTRGASAQELLAVAPGEVGHRADRALAPQQLVGERRDVAHVDAARRRRSRPARRARRASGHERAVGGEDDRRVERLRRPVLADAPAQSAPSARANACARVVARRA